jgi:N-acetylmuramoyl-L-alanine amidase CwlA
MLPITEKLITSVVRPRRPLKSLKGIVIHWTANTNRGAGAHTHYRYFNGLGPNDRKASAHYMVDDKEIIKIIPDMEVAYHVGAKGGRYTEFAKQAILEGPGDTPNNYLIGIELCVNSDSDLQQTRKNGAELTRHLIDFYGLRMDQIFRHYDITGKDCPQLIIKGKDADDWRSFKQEVQAVRVAGTMPASGMRLGGAFNPTDFPQGDTPIPFERKPWDQAWTNQVQPWKT